MRMKSLVPDAGATIEVLAPMQWLKDVVLIVLVEVLVVVPPTFMALMCQSEREAKPDRARIDLANIASATKLYGAKKGHNPLNIEALVAAQCVEQTPMDPWGRAYQYEWHDGGDRIFSLGKDAVRGGENENADIEVWVRSTATFCPAPDSGSSSRHLPPRAPGKSTGWLP